MKQYRKKFHAEWWSSDIKPKGKMKRSIEGSNRTAAKEEIIDELKKLEDVDDTKDSDNKELCDY